MADISMCFGRGCTVKQSCYRFRALSDGDNQTFANFDRSPIQESSDCGYFWPIESAEGPLQGEPSK